MNKKLSKILAFPVLVVGLIAGTMSGATSQKFFAESLSTNLSFATAADFKFNATQMADDFSDSSYSRYYKFTADKSSLMKLMFGVERGSMSNGDYGIKLYDENYTQIWSQSVRVYISGFSTQFNNICIQGGQYYVEVWTNDKYAGKYTLTATLDGLGESFEETQTTNNDFSTVASTISLNKKYKGALGYNDCKDFYKFYVPALGKINLNMKNSTDQKVNVKIYDDAMQAEQLDTLSSGNQWTWNVLLAPGYHYLVVDDIDSAVASGTYDFSLDISWKLLP